MRTLGIDLATRDGRTGVCEVVWRADDASAKVAVLKPSDSGDLIERIVEVRQAGGWVSIDAPFGFPVAFSEAVITWNSRGLVEGNARLLKPDWLDFDHCEWNPVNRRLTDAFVRFRHASITRAPKDTYSRWPLSSVVEQITPTAIRCAEILSEALPDPIDRVGRQRVVEAYPVAALRLWGISAGKYKSEPEDRRRVLREIQLCAPWLHVDQSEMWTKHDDAIDALLCALVARLASNPNRLSWPENAGVDLDLDVVAKEGWIHLPSPGAALNDLVRLR